MRAWSRVERKSDQCKGDKVKRVLITGTSGYIGSVLAGQLVQQPDKYEVSRLDLRNTLPDSEMFFGIDVVVNTVGIAHIRETTENRGFYFKINRDLAIQTAKAAKEAGVKQFIELSSVSVYGVTEGKITKQTEPKPTTAYGWSKLEADQALMLEKSSDFHVAILRPPMVYGKDCRGNYQKLRKFALTSPVFPNFPNERSMVFVGNLSEFVKRVIDSELEGLFFPQDAQYVSTADMVRRIALAHEKNIYLTRVFNPLIRLFPISVMTKVFGSLTLERTDVVDKFSLSEAIKMSEENQT